MEARQLAGRRRVAAFRQAVDPDRRDAERRRRGDVVEVALRHVHVGEVSDRVRERVPVIVCRLVRPDLGCDDREVERDADRLDRRLDEVTVRVREDSEQPAAAARLLELVPGLGEHRPVRQRFGRIGIHAQAARRLAEHVAVAPSGLLGLDNGLELVVALEERRVPERPADPRVPVDERAVAVERRPTLHAPSLSAVGEGHRPAMPLVR